MIVRFEIPDFVNAELDARTGAIDLLEANRDSLVLLRNWLVDSAAEIDGLLTQRDVLRYPAEETT